MESYDLSSQTDVAKLIGHVSLFAGIGLNEQHLLADKLQVVNYSAEEVVIEQGEIGDSLYIIVRGSVLVSIKNSVGDWVCINKLVAGDVFGEIAILRDIPRTARITTEISCTFLSINAKDFLEIYQFFPPKSRDNIQLVVAKRLADHF